MAERISKEIADTRGIHALQTATEKAPVTLERPVDSLFDLKNIPKPHVSRALVAVDNEHPFGSPGHHHNGLTVLQQHVAFFDRNQDGIVYPWETYAGFRAIGCNPLVSFLSMLFINVSFSYPTLDTWIPDPLLPIYIRNIHKTKHASDTNVFDPEGRFSPARFEEIFSKFARTDPQYLTFDELLEMTEALRNAFDPFGWIANKLEWGFTYWLVKNEKGMAPKDAIRGVYDGSFFEWLEKQPIENRNTRYV
ncbi:hypothetical protein O6H91_02G139900 [Diphasiastrum complanatum]|uniref:Uncharacterized protein n=1 Tax=Diphasiastrum complanatum TaxID=34168 RepID=A0ACC2ELK8_DIPCM|nr:hypothetical protein O6H91_02G139900 [Diphasiastrum complanatum]